MMQGWNYLGYFVIRGLGSLSNHDARAEIIINNDAKTNFGKVKLPLDPPAASRWSNPAPRCQIGFRITPHEPPWMSSLWY